MCAQASASVRLTRALSHAPKRAEERAFGIARGAQIRTMLYHTENDRPTCLSSTLRANILRGQTLAATDRIVSSFSLFLSLALSLRGKRIFFLVSCYVIRQTSKRDSAWSHFTEWFAFGVTIQFFFIRDSKIPLLRFLRN